MLKRLGWQDYFLELGTINSLKNENFASKITKKFILKGLYFIKQKNWSISY